MGRVQKVKGLRRRNWQLQNRHGDVKYSLGNVVNNIITTYDAISMRLIGVLDLLGVNLHKFYKFLTTLLYT